MDPKFEYEMAQDMLKHYDTLNWQIGSVLIAGVLIFTGLVINKDIIELMRSHSNVGKAIGFGVPALSLLILAIWLMWFRRHRDLYNCRNEVLHRIESREHMYHYLLVVEQDKKNDKDKNDKDKEEEKKKLDRLKEYKSAAGYATKPEQEGFQPLYPLKPLRRPSGYALAWALTIGIPSVQLMIMLCLVCAR
ncbi:MAG: hypothetical protein QOH71_2058 [Blastocatellia bacterium]|nr:hypothetical protein [Blastocatellia bacterium]